MLRKNEPLNLFVDAGNSLYKRPARITDDSLKKANTILQIYDEIGLDVFSPGPNDLAGGLEILTRQKASHMHIISSNLYSATSKSPIFEQFTQIQLGSSTITILGLTGDGPDYSPDYYLENYRDVLHQIIYSHKESTDYFVLLSSMSLKTNKFIAETFPDISIIVSADNRLSSIAPVQHHNTLIVQTVNRGKYLGTVEVRPGSSSLWGENFETMIKSTSRTLNSLEYQLRLKKQRAKQGQGDDKAIPELEKRIVQSQTELADLKESKKRNDEAFSHYTTRNFKLSNTVQADGRIETLINSLLKK